MTWKTIPECLWIILENLCVTHRRILDYPKAITLPTPQQSTPPNPFCLIRPAKQSLSPFDRHCFAYPTNCLKFLQVCVHCCDPENDQMHPFDPADIISIRFPQFLVFWPTQNISGCLNPNHLIIPNTFVCFDQHNDLTLQWFLLPSVTHRAIPLSLWPTFPPWPSWL